MRDLRLNIRLQLTVEIIDNIGSTFTTIVEMTKKTRKLDNLVHKWATNNTNSLSSYAVSIINLSNSESIKSDTYWLN